MDPALLTVASTSATALVSLMTTDVWERVKSGVSKVFTRTSTSPDAVHRELEESRIELQNSATRGDLDETTTEIEQMWKGKFRRLLAEHPEARTELEELVCLWQELPGGSSAGPGNVISQTATAHDNSRIYQQGSGIQHNN
ncbi:hypothetical protein ABZ798_12180 [Streptomyces sp. NPDC047803]|uniref:hypothetical protein n=1 Tax=Streptomyces sp. NPDC047803 TaxID=3160976 RepID=UPI0033EA0D02